MYLSEEARGMDSADKRQQFLQWWEIFKTTGDLEDGRAFVDALREYDLSLESEGGLEL